VSFADSGWEKGVMGDKKVNRRIKSWFIVICLILCVLLPAIPVKAADLDRILDYEITIDVNQDGTLKMIYHFDWKVLDSTSEGPLEWVKIGIPNNKYVSMKALTDNIKKIGYLSDGGSYARIDLDRKYKKDEVVTFEFELVQDYTYQMNKFVEGETVYEVTPGWFPDCRIDKMVIRWKADKVLRTDPAADQVNGYYVWTKTELSKGEKFPVQLVYSNDAYSFSVDKEIKDESSDDGIAVLIACLVIFGSALFLIVIGVWAGTYSSTANLGTEKKITRTKVVYYPSCPGCGGTRPDGANNCPYCGRSFIQSEEVIKEEDIPKEDKKLRKIADDGLYPFVSSPNTYMRVHVTHVPVSRPVATRSSCAHSSCACACACACAGGGRAGCSTKDFYNTNLKLKQLERKQLRGAK